MGYFQTQKSKIAKRRNVDNIQWLRGFFMPEYLTLKKIRNIPRLPLEGSIDLTYRCKTITADTVGYGSLKIRLKDRKNLLLMK
jgi:hypothetical protein